MKPRILIYGRYFGDIRSIKRILEETDSYIVDYNYYNTTLL